MDGGEVYDEANSTQYNKANDREDYFVLHYPIVKQKNRKFRRSRNLTHEVYFAQCQNAFK